MNGLDVLCLGEPLMEFNQQADILYQRGHGGDTSNVAVCAARQGAKTGYVTRLGSDAFGDSFVDLWKKEGIDCASIIRDRAAHTGVYFVNHSDEGHDFSYLRAGSAASLMTPDDLPNEQIRNSRILHVSGISMAISDSATDAVFSAIDIALESGTIVSVDPNLRLALWPLNRARAVTHAAMSRCKIALPGLDDARILTGHNDPDRIADFYLELGAEIVALTLGPNGVLVATPSQRRIVAGKSVQAVDATGAGDVFDGAFLAEIANGRSPMQAAEYANAAAALSTTGYGAVPAIPNRSDVETFLVG